MLSDSEVRCPGFFLKFFPVSVTDFHNALRLQQVIALRHSMAFPCNLVHEQTTSSPTSCSQIIYDLFLSFLHSFGFSKKWHLQITRRVLDYKSGEFAFRYRIQHRN